MLAEPDVRLQVVTRQLQILFALITARQLPQHIASVIRDEQQPKLHHHQPEMLCVYLLQRFIRRKQPETSGRFLHREKLLRDLLIVHRRFLVVLQLEYAHLALPKPLQKLLDGLDVLDLVLFGDNHADYLRIFKCHAHEKAFLGVGRP